MTESIWVGLTITGNLAGKSWGVDAGSRVHSAWVDLREISLRQSCGRENWRWRYQLKIIQIGPRAINSSNCWRIQRLSRQWCLERRRNRSINGSSISNLRCNHRGGGNIGRLRYGSMHHLYRHYGHLTHRGSEDLSWPRGSIYVHRRKQDLISNGCQMEWRLCRTPWGCHPEK